MVTEHSYGLADNFIKHIIDDVHNTYYSSYGSYFFENCLTCVKQL